MSNAAKRNAALQALRKEIKSSLILGVGSGTTVSYFIEELGSHVRKEGLDIVCVPSSLHTHSLCVKAGLRLVTLAEEPRLDLTVDGADEIDSELNLIKGGGGALTREKILASASKRFAVIADESKLVRRLGEKHPVPVEVLPFALGFVETQLRKFRPSKMTLRRSGGGKNGPVITDNGNMIIDLSLGPLRAPARISTDLRSIPGIVENGIFAGMADIVYLGGINQVKALC